jgi:hypothetical protein
MRNRENKHSVFGDTFGRKKENRTFVFFSLDLDFELLPLSAVQCFDGKHHQSLTCVVQGPFWRHREGTLFDMTGVLGKGGENSPLSVMFHVSKHGVEEQE